MKWSWAGHINCHKDDRWTTRVTTWRPYDKKRRQGRPAKQRRDDLDKYWSDMIWQRTAQDRANLETACWGLRPTTGHNGCPMMNILFAGLVGYWCFIFVKLQKWFSIYKGIPIIDKTLECGWARSLDIKRLKCSFYTTWQFEIFCDWHIRFNKFQNLVISLKKQDFVYAHSSILWQCWSDTILYGSIINWNATVNVSPQNTQQNVCKLGRSHQMSFY